MRGHKAGGYLDVARGGDSRKLYAAEGIEEALTARDLMRDGATYRAAGDLGNLAGRAVETVLHPSARHANGHRVRVPGPEPDMSAEAMPVPSECVELVLMKDGDSEPFLTDMALERAASRHDAPGRTIRIACAGAGLDFNALLRESL